MDYGYHMEGEEHLYEILDVCLVSHSVRTAVLSCWRDVYHLSHLIYICITMMISLGITLLFCMGPSLATIDDGPKPKGPPIRRHQNIQVDIEQERE